MADFRDVDPVELRLPPSRLSGADPYKLQRQIARFGASMDGMPPVLVYEGSDGALEIIDGATRATRAAKLAPGRAIRVEVIGKLHQPRGQSPRIWRSTMTATDIQSHLLQRLDEVRQLCPELRLGQLMATLGLLGEDATGRSLWEIEDDELAAALERFASDLARRSRDSQG